ncbi:lycopene cyclase domain-containing protein [archaeon]|jgi:lycopene beta-cyclase|nr:lycopene cyclase domain-containing protein [archaeon]MBT4021941.1 lycopene cyclase domain-containing protein [archaeon]MBT4272258.1 lycopene cyclase domain-containing protein [archaeon]MBT4460794.1 lycopene cyclase domain-containing protein [archaeon]MBT4858362.1 lycopene cyclase domain-containing protein [archaeon]
MEYLIILIGIFLITLFLEYKLHIHLYHSRKERIIIPLIFFIIGTIWDTYAVYRNHWTFSDSMLIGIKIGILPLEEYLFFLVVPYMILTLYKILDKKIK